MATHRPVQRVRAALAKDVFARLHSVADLGKLVAQTARRTARPYSELVGLLLGGGAPQDEARAREQWVHFVEHRRLLADSLGRPVHLRVAAIDLLMNTGSSHSPVMMNRRALGQLVTSATTDPLTGLANRAEFMTILSHELRQRSSAPLAVAYLDIDNFKQVNDTHGHEVGDKLLKALAVQLKRAARTGDVMARLGGDEFAALLVGVGLTRGRAVFQGLDAPLGNVFARLGVSLSVGLVPAKRGSDPDEVLKSADEAMYNSKKARKSGTYPAVAPAAPQTRPVVLYATNKPARYLALQQAFAAWGYPLIPAPTAAAAASLARLLPVRVALADIMFPPRGGAPLLASLPVAKQRENCLLVAPQRWWGMKGSSGYEVLRVPPDQGALETVFRRVLPQQLQALPPLGSEGEAEALCASVQAAMSGRAVNEDRLARIGTRAEWDVVRLHLGW